MILGFKEYFDKKKTQSTYFREKIWAGVYKEPLEGWYNTKYFRTDITGLEFFRQQMAVGLKPKLHTIRERHRWKAGDLMHMAYGVRTKNYQQFNKGIPELEVVKGVQKIEVFGHKSNRRVAVDGEMLNHSGMERLAVNDGFDSLDHFFTWFNKDFSGQIIHFTEMKY